METCRFFLRGCCRNGSRCNYAHDFNGKTESNVCRFYQNGSCKYGNSCRYAHIDRKQTISQSPELSSHSVSPGASSQTSSPNTGVDVKGWSKAAEFVPGRANHVAGEQLGEFVSEGKSETMRSSEELCPFAKDGECPYLECMYLHGDLCDMCGCYCLHPTNEKQRKEHQRECLEHHEREMELAFAAQAAQRSAEVMCSICLEVVKEKADITERRFGILENCDHPFCVGCIRKWRQSSHTEKSVIRACPICRVNSWFFTPSDTWVEDGEEKKKLIDNYKKHLKAKHCRNFNRGKGNCKFGSKCFYKHEYPDGTEEKFPKHSRIDIDIEDFLDSDDIAELLRALRLNYLFSDHEIDSSDSDSESEEDENELDSDSDVSVDPNMPGLVASSGDEESEGDEEEDNGVHSGDADDSDADSCPDLIPDDENVDSDDDVPDLIPDDMDSGSNATEGSDSDTDDDERGPMIAFINGELVIM